APPAEVYTHGPVCQRHRAGDVGAYEIPQESVASGMSARWIALHEDSVHLVARDNVGGAGIPAPHQAGARSSEKLQPILTVGQRFRACSVGADQVALNDAARQAKALERVEENAVLPISRN